MKSIVLIALFQVAWIAGFAGGDNAFGKGSSVYVESPDKELSQEVTAALRDWGYWSIAGSAGSADIVMRIEVKVSGGVTWTSWGGKSIALSAHLKSKSDSWQSPFYKASPNGSNGFNSQKAAVRKLVGGLKKQFR